MITKRRQRILENQAHQTPWDVGQRSGVPNIQNVLLETGMAASSCNLYFCIWDVHTKGFPLRIIKAVL